MNGDAKRLAREQAIATAHLIAAAPDLYAALIETLEIAARNEDGDFRIRARNALAKARPLTETEILYTPLEDLIAFGGPHHDRSFSSLDLEARTEARSAT